MLGHVPWLNPLKRLNRWRRWRHRAFRLQRRQRRFASFGRNAIGLLVSGRHGVFAVDPADDVVSRILLDSGTYGESELALAKSFLAPPARVLLVGAHIGTLAVPLSRLCRELVALEANPHTCRLLELNLRMNGCANVTAHQTAAAERWGPIRFLVNRDNSGGSKRVPLHRDQAYVYDNPDEIQVPAMPLDDLGPDQVFDLVLMDIEGSEYFALQGMPRILAGATVLMIEFIPHHLCRVAGVGVDEFLAPVVPHFAWMYVPQHDHLVECGGAAPYLQTLFDSGEAHDAIVFLKAPLPDWLQAKVIGRFEDDSNAGAGPAAAQTTSAPASRPSTRGGMWT
jgi:FkbM family methyltransferase